MYSYLGVTEIDIVSQTRLNNKKLYILGAGIFPSQTSQGTIFRQRGPGFGPEAFGFGRPFGGLEFSTDFSSVAGTSPVPGTPGPVTTMPSFPQGFPNGQALSLPGGIPSFGQSESVSFSRPFTPGSFPPTFNGGQTSFFGSQSQTFDPRFGFPGQPPVNPGPEFTTGNGQSNTDFNIAFQPLPPNQPQTITTNTVQIGDAVTSAGQSVSGNTGFETAVIGTGGNTAAVTNTVNERNVIEGNTGLETIGTQNAATVTTSSTSSQGGNEFRLVEVGNILDVPAPSATGNVEFQPSGDINNAFSSLTCK